MTLLAAAIMVHSLDQALADAARAALEGADLVELRIDHFTDPSNIADLVTRCPLPCIVTCRSKSEGGYYDGDEQTRIALLEHAGLATHPPAYIDLELASYQSSANLRQKIGLVVNHPDQVRPTDTGLILSAHDFNTRPADLHQIIAAMAEAPACRVIKIAWKARSLRDNLEVFELLQRRLKPTIALCMGPFGLPSRVLAKKFGALLTFAAIDHDQATAPGQPTIAQLKKLYRWDSLNADTRVFGVIGYPVAHSMSPAVHNAGFDAVGFNGVYLPLPIPPEYEHFKATVGSWLDMPGLNFRGASVTIPHKENLLRFVAERGGRIDDLCKQIGAANTLIVDDAGHLSATNTDYSAALDALCHALNIERAELAGLRVAVLGAGGAARAIVAGLAQYSATVVIYNRTYEKAQALAAHFNQRPGSKVVAARIEKLCDSCCQVYINCTPIGMHPNIDETPMPGIFVSDGPKGPCFPGTPDKTPKGAFTNTSGGTSGGTVVFDTIYNPLETRLLREARAAGCTTIPGLAMFTRQAAAQFEDWTGQPAPLDLFQRIVAQHLTP